MKITKFFALIAMVAVVLTSCKKDDPAPAFFLNATIDGAAQSSTVVVGTKTSATYIVVGTFSDNGALTLTSAQGNTALTEAGTYDVVPQGTATTDKAAFYASYTSADSKAYFGQTGTVTVTELTATSFKATFNFDAEVLGGTETIKVTSGDVSSAIAAN